MLASVIELISYKKFPEGRLESFVSISLFDFGLGREKYKFRKDDAGSLSTFFVRVTLSIKLCCSELIVSRGKEWSATSVSVNPVTDALTDLLITAKSNGHLRMPLH